MANTIKMLFWLYRSKKNKMGQTPLMLRLTFQNKRLDKATGYYVSPERKLQNKNERQKDQKKDSFSGEISISKKKY